MSQDEYLLTPEAVFEPATEVYYAYGLDEANRRRAELEAETDKPWKLALVLRNEAA